MVKRTEHARINRWEKKKTEDRRERINTVIKGEDYDKAEKLCTICIKRIRG